MAFRCFYVVDGEAAGPVAPEELLRLGRSGAFPGENLVWIEGTSDWQPFAQWAEIFEAENPRVVAEPPVEMTTPSLTSSPPSGHEPEEPAPEAAPIGEERASAVRLEPAPVMEESPRAALEQPETIGPSRASAGSVPGTTGPASGDGFLRIAWASLILLVASLAASFLSLALNLLSRGGPVRTIGNVAYWICLLAFLASLICAVVGVVGFLKHRNWRVLLPALVTLLIIGLLAAIALPGFSRARARAIAAAGNIAPSKPMTPVRSKPGATRVTHPDLKFAFDVPEGFVEYPPGNSTLKFWKVYGRPAAPGELSEIVGIQPLQSMLPRRYLTPADLPKEKDATISQVSWRGTMVDAFRFSETKDGKVYVSYKVLIPLKGEAIQFIFGVPAERESELKARVETLLASLDGSSDW